MLITNIKVFTGDRVFTEGAIRIKQDRIAEVVLGQLRKPGEKEEIFDGKGAYCFPGMIDIHSHGCMGADYCDGTKDALQTVCEYEAKQGVTAVAATTMTLSVDELVHILETIAEFKEEQRQGLHGECADLIGVNMEGPFISHAKKGAQAGEYILPADVNVYRKFADASKGLVKIIGIAPEESDALEYIQEVSKECIVSLAHTNADYNSAKAAIDAGASHLIHTWNAMPAFSHRAPGVIGAAVPREHVSAELICDGIHVHPASIATTFRMFGANRMVLISDSMRATGLTDGTYTLGGQEVSVKGNLATLVSDGAIAGSVTTLPDCVRFAIRESNIPLEEAIASATIRPAKIMKIDDEYGKIAPGYKANVVLWDANLDTVAVFKNGIKIV